MPTARQYIEEAIARAGSDFGIRVPISSLTTTTVVSSVMARGEPSSMYERQFITRLNTATVADRVRQVSLFMGTTGTFTHEGANYGDTTATGEYAWISRIPPDLVLRALQQSVENLRFLDTDMLPAYRGTRYWLRPAEFPWITSRSMMTRVAVRRCPVLTRNRYFQRWHAIDTNGVLTPPDFWVLGGSGATVTRVAQSDANLRKGAFVAQMTRNGTDCTVEQVVSVLPSGADLGGASGESLVGETVTAVAVVSASAANRCFVRLRCDGATIASSDYHTGGGEPEELTISASVPAGTKYLSVVVQIETGDTSVDIHEAYLVKGELTDGVRLDDYPEEDVEPRWTDGIPISFELPSYGTGNQIIIESRRPYPGFDPTRLYAGTADGDSHDAPLVPVAAGILYRCFLAYRDVDPEKYGRLAEEWRLKWENLAAAHTVERLSATGGANIPRPQNLAGARRLAR